MKTQKEDPAPKNKSSLKNYNQVKVFFNPTHQGLEKEINHWLEKQSLEDVYFQAFETNGRFFCLAHSLGLKDQD